jgi:hypothetical protein
MPRLCVALRGRATNEQFLDYLYQLIGGLGFRHEGVSSGIECRALDLRRIVRGKNDDLRRGRSFADFRSRLESVHYRHTNVEDNQIGLELENQIQRFLAILSFPANVPPRLAVEERLKPLAHDFMVVSENYPQEGTPWLEVTPSICHEVLSLPYGNHCISDHTKEFVRLRGHRMIRARRSRRVRESPSAAPSAVSL